MRKELLAISAVLSLAPGVAWGQARVPDLAQATLEELMNIEVTSASRREQRADDVPASIYVISHEEIRRSGLTSLAEVLRLAPGVQVSRVNSNKWTVSVRGFSAPTSKLLVLVDGRSIYNPAYSTVYWDTEDVMLEDVDRIEVIRGPGGAMWGANAMNGVINIITRPATETRGGLARVGGGTFDAADAGFRYGGGMGALSYRVFAQAAGHAASWLTSDTRAHDSWRSVTTGFRSDWSRGRDAVMLQAGATVGQQRPMWFDTSATTSSGEASLAQSNTHVGHALGRWTRSSAGGAALQVQGYFDTNHRDELIGLYDRRTWDVDAQYNASFGPRHAFVAGGGYRYLTETLEGRGLYRFTPSRVRPGISNGFAQDSVSLAGGRAEVTLGAKFEHSTYAGSAFQPNARLLWKATPRQRVWTAAARAVRTPSLVDRGLQLEYPAIAGPFGLPLVTGAVGNPDQRNEGLINLEAGYRINVSGRLTIDAVAFRGWYDDLQTQEPPVAPSMAIVNGLPTLIALARYDNLWRAETVGIEVAARLQMTHAWTIDGSMSTFGMTPHAGRSLDTNPALVDGNTGAQQWRLHSSWSLGGDRLFDARLMRVGRLAQAGLPGYTRLDARLEWPLARRVSAVGSGQNLLDSLHRESVPDGGLTVTQLPRSATLGLVWRF